MRGYGHVIFYILLFAVMRNAGVLATAELLVSYSCAAVDKIFELYLLPPFIMEAEKWPRILKLGGNILNLTGQIFQIRPRFPSRDLWTLVLITSDGPSQP